MRIDTLDKQYQKSPDFPPDKADKWKYPEELDGTIRQRYDRCNQMTTFCHQQAHHSFFIILPFVGWMLAHNGIRMELKQMGEALEAAQKRGPIQQWEVSCIQSFWKAHYMHVMSHHSNEDNLMVPYLKERVNYPEKLTADHTELVDKLNTIDSIVKGLGSSKEEETVDELLKEMKELTGIMLPHLKEEEEQGLPLARAYFEPEEIARVVQKILKDSPAVSDGEVALIQTTTLQ